MRHRLGRHPPSCHVTTSGRTRDTSKHRGVVVWGEFHHMSEVKNEWGDRFKVNAVRGLFYSLRLSTEFFLLVICQKHFSTLFVLFEIRF